MRHHRRDHEGPALEADEVRGLDAPRDAAEVEHELRLPHDPLVVDLGVGGDDAGDVGRRELAVKLDRFEAELRKLGDVRVVVGDVGAEVASSRMIFSAGASRRSPTPAL